MATKILHLEELFQREIADLARDEILLSEAFEKFREASKNPVLEEILGRIRTHALDLGEKLTAVVDKTKETRRDAVRGIIIEGQGRAKEIGDSHLVDVELLCTAQRLLGYQLAGYRSILPITRMLKKSDLTLICEAAVESKEKAVKSLTEVAVHQVHWRASWWSPEHTSAWQKVKILFKEDWARTKEHLGVSEQPSASEQERASEFDANEPAFRYGYGAALHYQDRQWNDSTMELLRSQYGGLWDERTRPKVEAGWRYSREGREARVQPL